MDCLRPSRNGEAHAAEDGFFGHAEHRSGMRGDARDEFFDGFFELGFGDEAIDHAEFEGALGGYRLAGQDDLERDFRTDEIGQDRGGERRKHADGDFGLRETRFRRGDDQVAERGQLGATADGRTVYDADDRLADFEHAGEGGVKGFEHLEDALRGVFADVDAARENFAGGVEDDELGFFGVAGEEMPSAISRSMASLRRLWSGRLSVMRATFLSIRNFTDSNWLG